MFKVKDFDCVLVKELFDTINLINSKIEINEELNLYEKLFLLNLETLLCLYKNKGNFKI